MFPRGRVVLAGARSGAPEVLKLKGMRALREAKVVLHDDLVPRAVLSSRALMRDSSPWTSASGCRSTPPAFNAALGAAGIVQADSRKVAGADVHT